MEDGSQDRLINEQYQQSIQPPPPPPQGPPDHHLYSTIPGAYYYPHYPPPRSEGKKFLNIPLWTWVLLILFILFFGCLIVGYLTWFWRSPDDDEIIEEFSSEIIIGEGGHYKYDLGWFYYDEVDIVLNISSRDGSHFDVYIMSENQYENAYDVANTSMISFSATYAKENMAQLDETVELTEEESDGIIYVIIDNRDTPVTPNDAVPSGILTLDVNITVKTTYGYPVFID